MRRVAQLLVAAALVVSRSSPAASARAETNPWQSLYDHATYVAGDSITLGASPYLQFLWAINGRLIHIDAHGGKTLVQGLAWLQAQRAAPPMAPTAVIALGGNDDEDLLPFMYYVEGAVDTLLNPLPGSPPVQRILWVNFYARSDLPYYFGGNTSTYDPQKNQVLDFVASLHRGQVTVLDWASLSAQHPEWMLADGLHYTDQGYAQLAIFSAKAVAAAVP